MRPSLLPGLLAAAARNAARGAESIALFEVGRRYLEEGERPTLGLVLAGPRGPRHWRGKGRPLDAYDAKAEALAILAAAGAPVDNLQVLGDAPDVYHPGPFGAALPRPEERARHLRRAPPRVAAAFDLDGPVAAAEISSTRFRKSAARPAICAAPMRRRAAGGEARLRLPRPRRSARRQIASRRAWRRQGGDHGGEPVRRLHRRRQSPRATSRSPSK